MDMRKIFLFFTFIFCTMGCSKTPILKAYRSKLTSVESIVTTISAGTVEAEQMAMMGFGMSGRVKSVLKRSGDKVKTGDLIAELENDELITIYRESAKEQKRAAELFSEGLIAKTTKDDAEKAYDVAKANLDRSMIKAPFDGIIAELNLQVGDLVGQNMSKVPVRIIDLIPRIVKGVIDEFDLSKVKVGQLAKVIVPSVRRESFQAYVSKVIPFISTTREQDRTVQIELKFEEGGEIVPVGASADIQIIIEKKEKVLSVPSRVILGTQQDRYLFKYKSGKLQKTKVTVGVGNYDRMEIKSGLELSEIVVQPSENVELVNAMKVKIELINESY